MKFKPSLDDTFLYEESPSCFQNLDFNSYINTKSVQASELFSSKHVIELENIGSVANLQTRPDIMNLFVMKKTLQIQNGRTILTMFH